MVQFSIKRPTPVTAAPKNKKRFEFTKISKPLLLAIIVAVAGGAYGIYRYATMTNVFTEEVSQTAPDTQKIDFSPATENDKADVDAHKADLANGEAPPGQTPSEKKTVTPIIVGSSASPVAVRSYVSGVIESGGVCTLNLTNGSTTVTAEGTATAGAQTTDCPELTAILPSPGVWKATISYLSASAQGTSSQDWEIVIE